MSIARTVPCNGCVLCCERDTIYIHPELGDDSALYETKIMKGKVVLKHKSNGDCIYLTKSGCSIYERRPAICKEYSCALFVQKTPNKVLRKLVAQGVANKHVVKRGKELLRRGYRPG